MLTSAYVINRIPSRVLGCKSPLETLYQFYSDIRSSFNLAPRVFEYTSFVHIHNHNRGKLDLRSLKCVFVGYSSNQKGYKCYHPPTRKLYVSTGVTFVENKPYFSTPYLQGELSILEDEELAIPSLEIIPSSESFKSKETTSVLPISLEPIPISQSEESVEEKEEDIQIFDQFRFDQVYVRRRDPTATRQEQSTEPSPGNEVTRPPLPLVLPFETCSCEFYSLLSSTTLAFCSFCAISDHLSLCCDSQQLHRTLWSHLVTVLLIHKFI